MSLALKLALRDLRGGLGGLRLLAVCLFLGVAAIAGIGSLSAAIVAQLAGEGRTILGGDIEVAMPGRQASLDERGLFERLGTVSESAKLNAMVADAHPVTSEWITDAEMAANPGLVKTMSVKPPRGSGRVRLVAIGDIDLQPCGGTHVRNTAEIGLVAVTDIEKKGKQNRRVRIALA